MFFSWFFSRELRRFVPVVTLFSQPRDDSGLTEAVSELSFYECDRTPMRRQLHLAIMLVPLAVAGMPAHADNDRSERQQLTEARKRGDILALSEILDRLPGQIGDNIIEVEFEGDDGRFIYEIYYLDADGRRREITVDARDASILDHEDD
jgi:uncharacterized membrane protein YkoI